MTNEQHGEDSRRARRTGPATPLEKDRPTGTSAPVNAERITGQATPLPADRPPPSTGVRLRRDALPVEQLLEVAQSLPLGLFKIGEQSAVLISDPSLADELLLGRLAPLKRSQREEALSAVISPLCFSPDAISERDQRRFGDALRHASAPAKSWPVAEFVFEGAAKRWAQSGAQSGESLSESCALLGAELSAALLFGVAEVNEVAPRLLESFQLIEREGSALLFGDSSFVGRLFGGGKRKLKANVEALELWMSRQIRARLGSENPGEELLARWVQVQDTHHRPISEQLVREELITFSLIMGPLFAEKLCCAIDLISEDEELGERLFKESASIDWAQPPVDAIEGNLPLAYGLWKEAERLCPSIWLIARQVEEPLRLAGLRIEPNVELIVSPLALQRDPRRRHQPERCRPQRWLPGGEQDAIPESCAGQSVGQSRALALIFQERFGPLLISQFTQRLRFKREEGAKEGKIEGGLWLRWIPHGATVSAR
ncbi:MAG: cytochrome P450 [Myxococcota bacterium]|nr:cytochrome P450 [Myxococcota bacterium]